MPRMIAPITVVPAFRWETLLDEGAPIRAKENRPRGAVFRRTGGDLLSQGVAPQVPSAQRGLTALFGMGRGVSLSLSRHQICRDTGGRGPLRWSLKTTLGKGRKQISVKPSTH